MVEQLIHKGETVDRVIYNPSSALDTCFVQEEGSHLRLHLIRLSQPNQPLQAADHIHIQHLGENCSTEIYSLYFLRGKDQASLHTQMCHQIGKGSSKQLIKFVLDDEAQGEFFGEMKIDPDAQKVEALQTNRNLLLSPKATMRTRPQLEIYADDVKASHGASTGQLDESSLFYMQQRCISPEEGRKLLIRAFMADIIDSIEGETQREELMNAIDGVIQ